MTEINRFFRFVAVSAALLLAGGCVPSATLDPGSSNIREPLDDTVVVFEPEQAFKSLNETRRKFFLAGFRQDERLMEAARRHAELMGRTGRFGHEFGPETKFKRRIFSVGFQNSAGENLGVGYRSIDEAIDGWLKSPDHRKILLKRKFTLGGIAYARNSSGKNPRLNHFWVLILGEG